MQIKELLKAEEILQTFPILKEAYEGLDENTYTKQILDLIKEGHKIAAIFDNELKKYIGITIIKTNNRLQYGKTLEITDIFILKDNINEKSEKILIEWIELQAKNSKSNKILSTIDSSRIQIHKILSKNGFLLEGFKFIK